MVLFTCRGAAAATEYGCWTAFGGSGSWMSSSKSSAWAKRERESARGCRAVRFYGAGSERTFVVILEVVAIVVVVPHCRGSAAGKALECRRDTGMRPRGGRAAGCAGEPTQNHLLCQAALQGLATALSVCVHIAERGRANSFSSRWRAQSGSSRPHHRRLLLRHLLCRRRRHRHRRAAKVRLLNLCRCR